MISAALIKELRDTTGAGMLDCKKALEKTGGDIQKAIDWLRENGIAKAAKKNDRIAAEGLTYVLENGNNALIIELNSETDFVAKNDSFKHLVDEVSKVLINSNVKTLEEALALEYQGLTIENILLNATAKIGEKISLRRFELLTKSDKDTFGLYVHMGGKISSIVLLEGNLDKDIAKNFAMHVCASDPKYLTPKDVPQEIVDRETNVQLELSKKDEKLINKSEKDLLKIVEGRVNKNLKGIVLSEQAFIMEPSLSVEKYAKQSKTNVISFVRFAVGEGIEKKVNNFAEEVMSQVRK